MAIKLADTLVPMADFPAVDAKDVAFSDNKTLQEKYDNGELGGGGSGSGEENKIDSISINGSPITPDENKNVDITVPTVTNDLTDELKSSYDDAVSAKHTHDNKDTLDKISASSDGRLLYDGNNMPVVIPTSQPSVLLAGSIWIETV